MQAHPVKALSKKKDEPFDVDEISFTVLSPLAAQNARIDKLKKYLFKTVREQLPEAMDLLQAFITHDADVVKFGVDFVHDHKSEIRDIVLDKSFKAWEENFIHKCIYQGLQTVKELSLTKVTESTNAPTIEELEKSVVQQIELFVKITVWELFNELLMPNLQRESSSADKSQMTLIANWKGKRYTLSLANDEKNHPDKKKIVMRLEKGVRYLVPTSESSKVELQEQSLSADSYNGMLPFNITDTATLVQTLLDAIKIQKNRQFLANEILMYHLHYSRVAEIQEEETSSSSSERSAQQFIEARDWQLWYKQKIAHDADIAELQKKQTSKELSPTKRRTTAANFLDPNNDERDISTDEVLFFTADQQPVSDEELAICNDRQVTVKDGLDIAEQQAEIIHQQMLQYCASEKICQQYIEQYRDNAHARLGKWSASLYAREKKIQLVIYDVQEEQDISNESSQELITDTRCSTVSTETIFAEVQKANDRATVFLAYRNDGLYFRALKTVSNDEDNTNTNVIDRYFAEIQTKIREMLTRQLLQNDYLADLVAYSKHLENELKKISEQHEKSFNEKNEGVSEGRALSSKLEDLCKVKATKTQALKQLTRQAKTDLCAALEIDETPNTLERFVYTVTLLPDTVRDDNGETLLHAASKVEYRGAVKFLLTQKADLFVENNVWAGRYIYVIDSMNKSLLNSQKYQGCYIFQRAPTAALYLIDYEGKQYTLKLDKTLFTVYDKAASGYQLRLRNRPPQGQEIQEGKLYLYLKPADTSKAKASNTEPTLECCGIAPDGKKKVIPLDRIQMGETLFQDIKKALEQATRSSALSKAQENYIFDLVKAELFYPCADLDNDIPLNAQIDNTLLKLFCSLLLTSNSEHILPFFGMYDYRETSLLIASLKKDALTNKDSLFFELLTAAQTALSVFAKRQELEEHKTLQALSKKTSQAFNNAFKAYQTKQKNRLENVFDQFASWFREILGVDALPVRAWECAVACGIVFKALQDQNFDSMKSKLHELFQYQYSPHKSNSTLHQELKKAETETTTLVTLNRPLYDDAYNKFIVVPFMQQIQAVESEFKYEREMNREQIENQEKTILVLTKIIEEQKIKDEKRDKNILEQNTIIDDQKAQLQDQGKMLIMLMEQMNEIKMNLDRIQQEQSQKQDLHSTGPR